jgi:GTP-binding protein
MLDLHNYRYWGSARSQEDWPKDGLVEVGVVGRSNVGKSSLINTLLGSKKAARTSSNPGKTRSLNFYLIDNKFYLVDFPGYGYAKVSKSERVEWKKSIEQYLQSSRYLKKVFLLVDARHEPFKTDVEMKQWFDEFNIPVLVVATKSDKLSKNKLSQVWSKNLGSFSLNKLQQICFFSSITGDGKSRVIKEIEELLG